MLISRNWLQHFFDAKLPDAEALADGITFHAFEIEGVEKKGDDDVLDVKITPNRGHDALSHRGVAREVSAIFNIPLAHDPLAEVPVLAPTTDKISVSIDDPEFCTRYVAGYVTGVKVGPSPLWLKKNLENVGQRSINNVVDSTNFVMFNLGQPLHAFDAGKLKEEGGKYSIRVRPAEEGEKMLALDKKEYTLTKQMSVIADANTGEAIGIAGVKGGEPAGVTEATADIIIEAANFRGASVRKTAAALKLRTDASARFEQVLSPTLCASAIYSVALLIQKIAGGTMVGFVDVYPSKAQELRVSVSAEKINATLGTRLSGAEIADVFIRLGFSYKDEDGEFEVLVPAERLDITIPEDLIEEVARIVGYDTIPGVMLPPPEHGAKINPEFFAAERAREDLVAQGYSEVYTSVFAQEGERMVLNKADSVKPFMRTSLIPGLRDALKKNIPNKDLLGIREPKLFEIGVVWRDNKEVVMLARIGEKEPASEIPLEAIEGEGYEVFPLSSASQFASFSKYPYIVRDIALWVPKDTDPDGVKNVLYQEGGQLVQKISLFDRFEKGEKTSLAFRLIFQSFDRTLTEVEVNEGVQKVSDALKKQGFEIR